MIVSTNGDYGDCIVLCGILRCLPDGPHTLLIQYSPLTKIKSAIEAKRMLDVLHPLISIQSYISEFRLADPIDPVDWRSGDFRARGCHQPTDTLMNAHGSHLYLERKITVRPDPAKPWLKVRHVPNKRVIINRTLRYNNHRFPWREIVKHYGERLLFIGSPGEHRTFQDDFGSVAYRRTRDFLEVAELIAGSHLFIGNQSSCGAVAEGLKHPLIQETCTDLPDCIYWRENVQYIAGDSCVLPSFEGEGDKLIDSPALNVDSVKKNKTPPDGWRYQGSRKKPYWDHALRAVVTQVVADEGGNPIDVEKLILRQNIDRAPTFFRSPPEIQFGNFHQALQNAKIAASKAESKAPKQSAMFPS